MILCVGKLSLVWWVDLYFGHVVFHILNQAPTGSVEHLPVPATRHRWILSSEFLAVKEWVKSFAELLAKDRPGSMGAAFEWIPSEQQNILSINAL